MQEEVKESRTAGNRAPLPLSARKVVEMQKNRLAASLWRAQATRSPEARG
jgi:hypothetical protein